MTDNWNVYTISPLSKGLTQTLVREVTPQINLNSVPSPLWIFNLVDKTYSGSPTFFNSVILGPHTLMISISSLPLAQPCSLSHTGLFFLNLMWLFLILDKFDQRFYCCLHLKPPPPTQEGSREPQQTSVSLYTLPCWFNILPLWFKIFPCWFNILPCINILIFWRTLPKKSF